MNKEINGHQCTIGWHVDDLKISHTDKGVLNNIIQQLEEKYGKEAPLTVHQGKVHEYLGMNIDYSNLGKVVFSMHQYVADLLKECNDELLTGHPQSPASNHLFEINADAKKLDEEKRTIFHHLTAKLLYLAKCSRPDILLAVAFLATRAQNPDTDDYKKLARCLSYLREHPDLSLTLEGVNMSTLRWWVDASFGVHPDMKSHTGAVFSMGKGCPINISAKQKINTRSSTQAELVGINDAMSMILWVRHFLEAQGYVLRDNIIYQDNQSMMLLAKNGCRSRGKKTRHIEIQYYFITDQVKHGKAQVKYCPTEDMVADFFTKPLQGAAFCKLRAMLLNLPVTPGQECVGTCGAEPVRVRPARPMQNPRSANV